ncbi:MAG: phage baseplate assembly protein V [Niabella sp.]
MPENSILAKTEITIQDYNNNGPVVFSNLLLTESFISVNNFSFSIRPANDEATLNSIIDFKKQVLGKEVQLSFKDGDTENHKFKGVILEVNASLIDNHYYEFKIEGRGLFCKVNELPEFHSFYKKKIDAIIDGAFDGYELKNSISKNAQTTKELHYIVQYNQTAFEFAASLAIRFGEWMFYDGEKLQFGKKPDTAAIELKIPDDISNLNIKAQAVKRPRGVVGTDIFKSASIQAGTKEPAPDNALIKAAEDSGNKAVEDAKRDLFIPSGFTQDVVNDKFKLEQQAILAASVFITGNTRNNKLSVGKIVKIKDRADDSGKSYILTQVQHNAARASSYFNSFIAIPAEAPVPPYTNPLLVIKATPQAAIITENEDDSGLARVKVKFPWMADDEKSPWISVLTPHSGKDKGFRFLPEKDDEVMVDFWDGNIETPFVNGSLYTDKNKPGIEEKGNNIKMIGSRTGRSILIDDDEGTLSISDGGNAKDKGKNLVRLTDSKDGRSVKIVSGEDGDNHYAMILDYKNKNATFYCQAGGDAIMHITFDADKKELTVFSENDMNIKSNGSINIDAKKEVNLKAGKGISYTANEDISAVAFGDFKAEGMNVNLKADVGFKAEGGATAEVQGVQANVKGSAMTTIKGAMVMIN